VSNLNDPLGGAASVSGTAAEDQVLTASNTLSDADGLGSISYQWQRNSGSGFANVAGATGTSYTLGDADVGATIRVVASYTDGHGTAESAASAATATVANINDAPTGSVTIAGDATTSQVLTASNTLADADGLGSISYQWQRNSGSRFANIAAATAATYTLGSSDLGSTVRVLAHYTDGRGTAESVASAATTTVNAPADLDVLNTMTLSSQAVVAFGTTAVKLTLANSGAGPAAASKVGYYRSADATFDASDTFIAERAFGAISAQSQVEDSFALTLTTLGTYFIIAVADYNNQIAGETSEGNNASNAVQVTVSASETISNSDGSRTVHTVDALDQHAFRDYFINYDTLNRVTSQLTNNDDGSHLNQVWDVQNQNDWANYYITYDSQNRIVGQVTLNDDNSNIVLKWDVANAEDWADYYVTYDGQNRPITQVTHNDDGSRIVFKWDRDNAFDWSDYRVTYDGQDRPITQVTHNDDGSQIVFKWDLDNQFAWIDYRVTTDSLGRAVSQVTNNDDGTHVTYGWDVQNTGTWSDYAVTTDSQNRVTTQTTHYDDGTSTVAKWDVQNAFNWREMTDYYDAQGHHLQQRGIYDDGTPWLA
jgi:hypothetical protein